MYLVVRSLLPLSVPRAVAAGSCVGWVDEGAVSFLAVVVVVVVGVAVVVVVSGAGLTVVVGWEGACVGTRGTPVT